MIEPLKVKVVSEVNSVKRWKLGIEKRDGA